jgi:hypothetical protein
MQEINTCYFTIEPKLDPTIRAKLCFYDFFFYVDNPT